MKTRITTLFLVGILLLSSCASSTALWMWTVTRFHNLGPIQGCTFVVVPLRKEYVGSLEFDSYAALVSGKFRSLGLVQRTKEEIGKTDYLFALDYGIGDPYQVIYSYPIFGQTAGGSTTYNSTIYSAGRVANVSGTATTTPQYGIVGAGTRSLTNYRQFVHLFVFDGRLSTTGELVRRYEGKAEGHGYLNDLTKIVPSGLKAIFADFPGQSGASKAERFQGLDQKP
jgi:hypothetical protein